MFRFRVFALGAILLTVSLGAVGMNEPVSAPAEPNGVLSFSEAWALTLLHNPRLKVFSYEVRAAEARQVQAAVRPNPTLDIEIEDFGGSGELSGFDGAETSIMVSQPLELGGKRQKRMQTALIERQLAGLTYEVSRREVRTELGQAFAEVLAAQERARIYGELEALSQEGLQTVRKRVAAGKDSPPEATRAAVEHSRVHVQARQAKQALEFSRRKLASFWAFEGPAFGGAAGDLESLEALPGAETLREQLARTPQWTRWDKEIARSRAVLEEAKAQGVPDIAVGAGVKRFNETDENALMVGISIPLPLFDRNQGGRQEARINLAKSFEEQRAGQLELINELDRLVTELENTRLRIEALREMALPGGREVLEASRKAYAEGKTDYLTLLDAQRTLFDVREEYVESLGAYHKARAELEGLIGPIDEAADAASLQTGKEDDDER